MTLQKANLQGNYFSTSGHSFLAVGAHWIPAVAGLQWPLQWDAASVENDFKIMKELGYNTVRFDLFWAWFEPYPGEYNPKAFEQLDYFIQLAHKYEIYLHPALFIGGEVGEAFWDVPWRKGRHLHSDAEMLRLQTNHAAEFGRRYAEEPAIIAWDLTDEPPFWIELKSTTDAMAINWTRLIAGAIRRYDKNHAICVGTSMEDIGHGPFRPDNLREEVDFYTVHPYSIYAPWLFPDAMVSLRQTYCGEFQTLLSGGAGHPVMVHELGASSAQYTPQNVAAFDRTSMYSSLGIGANGFLLWCYTDAAPILYAKAPYLRAPHETQFGMTTWDHKVLPQGQAFTSFSKVTGQMNLDGIRPAKADLAIMVPYEWQKPAGDFSKMGLAGSETTPYTSVYDGGAVEGDEPARHEQENAWLTGSWLSSMILSRQAGYKPEFAREYESLEGKNAIVLPSPLTSTELPLAHVHTSFWKKVTAYVQKGGAVYASVCADAAIPEMSQIFGARLADHLPASEVTLKVVRPFGCLKVGDAFHYQCMSSEPRSWGATLELDGAEVIAEDQNGNPAIVCYQAGKGKALLCAYPIEVYLAVEPAAFEHENLSYKLYRAFMEWAGIKPLVDSHAPAVETAVLSNEVGGYVVFTNHSSQAVEIKATTLMKGNEAFLLTENGKTKIAWEEGIWKLQIPAWDGCVVEWN